jgi:hypothetical protein
VPGSPPIGVHARFLIRCGRSLSTGSKSPATRSRMRASVQRARRRPPERHPPPCGRRCISTARGPALLRGAPLSATSAPPPRPPHDRIRQPAGAERPSPMGKARSLGRRSADDRDRGMGIAPARVIPSSPKRSPDLRRLGVKAIVSLVLDAGRREVTFQRARLSHPAGISRLGPRASELSKCRAFVIPEVAPVTALAMDLGTYA